MAEVAAVPLQYSAAREAAIDEMNRQKIPNVPPVVLSIPDTKIRSFERAPEGLKAEFEQWMSHDEETRILLVQDIASRWTHPVELCRNMEFVIWLEAVHPFGSDLVAGRAFNTMFAEKKAARMKKK